MRPLYCTLLTVCLFSLLVILLRGSSLRASALNAPALCHPSKETEKRCRIYSYLSQSFPANLTKLGHTGDYQTKLLAEAWRRHWFSLGFEPVFLSELDAMQHPRYSYFRERFSALPTVNADWYELGCYLRWVALAAVGGGVLIDYDIFSMRGSFDWGDFRTDAGRANCQEDGRLVGFSGFHPMITSGNASEIERLLNVLVTYTLEPGDLHNGKPHISDMIIATKRASSLYSVMVNPGASVAHFAHDFFRTRYPEGRSARSAFISDQLHLNYLDRTTIHMLQLGSSDSSLHRSLAQRLALCNFTLHYDVCSDGNRSFAAYCRDWLRPNRGGAGDRVCMLEHDMFPHLRSDSLLLLFVEHPLERLVNELFATLGPSMTSTPTPILIEAARRVRTLQNVLGPDAVHLLPHRQVFIGIHGRFKDVKTLLSWTVGFTSSVLDIPEAFSLTRKRPQLSLEMLEVLEPLVTEDLPLYRAFLGIFEDRLQHIRHMFSYMTLEE